MVDPITNERMIALIPAEVDKIRLLIREEIKACEPLTRAENERFKLIVLKRKEAAVGLLKKFLIE